MKGTSDEGTERGKDGARERVEGGRERAEKGFSEKEKEQGMNGARDGGKLQGRYPEKSTGQNTVHPQTRDSIITTGTNYKLCIVMRHNVLLNRRMT